MEPRACGVRALRLVAIGLAAMAGTSCGPSVSVSRPAGATGSVGGNDRVCVATAVDGRHETRVYAGSGQKVTRRTAHALREHHADVVIIGTSDLQRLAEECRSQEGRFVVVPEILEWEDRASGWSGRPDRVEVQLTLHDVASASAVRSVSVTVQTNFWSSAFGEWGNRPPEALLSEEFDRAAVGLLSP
jgi:Domain of unknown function (DUF4823)